MQWATISNYFILMQIIYSLETILMQIIYSLETKNIKLMQ